MSRPEVAVESATSTEAHRNRPSAERRRREPLPREYRQALVTIAREHRKTFAYSCRISEPITWLLRPIVLSPSTVADGYSCSSLTNVVRTTDTMLTMSAARNADQKPSTRKPT